MYIKIKRLTAHKLHDHNFETLKSAHSKKVL